MKTRVLSTMLLVLMLSGQAMAAAEHWQFESVERMRRTLKTAWVTNDAGYRFSLVRDDKGRVTAIFRVPKDEPILLGTNPPVYRVDDREERAVASWGVYVEMGTKQVSWFIWDGTGDPCAPEGPAAKRGKELCEIMQGQKMVFRFYRVTGEAKTTEFSLKGSLRAIQPLLQ